MGRRSILSPRRRRRQAIAGGLALATLAGVLVGTSAALGATPPPNPTDGQLNAAAKAKAAVSREVGAISAKIAQMQGQLAQLKANEELAEQKFAYAYSQLQLAQQNAAKTAKAVAAAKKQVAAAEVEFRSYALATYESGDLSGTTGSLLTAPDPSTLLQQAALENYESAHQVNAIDKLQAATVAKANADAKARAAVAKRASAESAAKAAKTQADQALTAAQAEQQQLNAQLATENSALQAARLHLATLNHQRAAFIQYQKHQAWLRHQAYLKHQRWLAHQRELAQQKAQQQQNQNSGGGGGGGSSGPPPVTSGNQQQIRENVVARAEHYLGWMYAWAGGNSSGPTYGVCAGDGAENDCHVIGFDCSGLALYAWAPYVGMPHYSASQYEISNDHPSISNLQLGDLVFWSSNGTVAGIHHVAIYIGNGMVIQAPESGETIRETPLDEVDWGYYGATDPLG